MPERKQRVRFYRASDMDSLEILKTTCEAQETRLTSTIVKVEIAKAVTDTDQDAGIRGTAATYEEVDGGNLGKLALVEFADEAEANLLKGDHELDGETFLFRGRAQIGNSQKKIMVFRRP